MIAIAARDFHRMALNYDGTVSVWGWGGEGQLDQPAGLSNVIAIAAGTYHNMVLKNDGTVVAWGATYPEVDSGQVAVPGALTNVVAISAGAGHGLAISIPLQIISVTFTDQSARLRFCTFSGQQYTVESSPDLSPGSWSALPGGSVSGFGQSAS